MRLVSIPNISFVYPLLTFQKKSMVQKILHKLKYEGQQQLGVFLGELLGAELLNFADTIDYIIPVPLHPSKLRSRGYNQSRMIAQGISNVIEKEVCDDTLFRTRKTASQTQKSKIDRWQNVSNVFRVRRHANLKGKRLLLVDDVITTGATVMMVAEAIQLTEPAADLAIVCVAAEK